jgi:hypothetical protein
MGRPFGRKSVDNRQLLLPLTRRPQGVAGLRQDSAAFASRLGARRRHSAAPRGLWTNAVALPTAIFRETVGHSGDAGVRSEQNGRYTASRSLTADGRAISALHHRGDLRCWGTNYAGQLGDGTTMHRTTPPGAASFSTCKPSPRTSRLRDASTPTFGRARGSARFSQQPAASCSRLAGARDVRSEPYDRCPKGGG